MTFCLFTPLAASQSKLSTLPLLTYPSPSTPGPLHGPHPLPEMLSCTPTLTLISFYSFFRCHLKCHFLREAFPDFQSTRLLPILVSITMVINLFYDYLVFLFLLSEMELSQRSSILFTVIPLWTCCLAGSRCLIHIY